MLADKTWTPDSALRLMASVCASLAFVGLLGYAADWYLTDVPKETRLFLVSTWSTLTLHGIVLCLVQRFLRENGLRWGTAFGLANPRRVQALFLGLGVAVVVFPVNAGLVWVSQQLMEWRAIPPVVQPTVQVLRASRLLSEQLQIGLLALVMAPVVEELLFRGILYPSLKQAGYPRIALWATAVLFAATHANLMTFLPLMFFSLVLTLLYEHTGNLLAPMASHSLFNAANFIWLVVERLIR